MQLFECALRAAAASSVLAAACVSERPPGIERDPNLVAQAALELGEQALDESFWEPTDEPFVLGFVFDLRHREHWLGGELGVDLAYDESDLGGPDAVLTMVELWLGPRKTFTIGERFHPYVGFGPTLIDASAKIVQGGFTFDEDSDTTFGGYVHAGAFYEFSQHFSLGLDARWVFGTDVDIAGAHGDVDYQRLGLTLGWLL